MTLKSSAVLVIFTATISIGSIKPLVAQSLPSIFIVDATASKAKVTTSKPTDAIDNSDSTWWSSDTKGEYLELNTGGIAQTNAVNIKFYDGDKRTTTFDVDGSTDGLNWTRVVSNQSSQRTSDLEQYSFPNQKIRYLRIVNRGNSTGDDAIAIRQIVIEGVPTNKTYYVDCNNSSDTNNDGTTPSTAWKTLTPVNH